MWLYILSLFSPPRRRPFTDVFTSDYNINRQECQRVRPMKVLALGVGRTGTAGSSRTPLARKHYITKEYARFKALRTALKRLGFEDTYHMMSASIENAQDCAMWMDAFAAKYDGKGTFGRQEWDQLLGHCQAVCDWPACAFAKELIETYPDAKVILTTRDIDSWHKSVMKTVWWRVMDPQLVLLSKVDWSAGLYYPMLRRFFDEFFRGDFPTHGKAIYAEHYDMVRKLVPQDRLLEFNVSESWGPLCDFLDVAEPKGEAFPRSNDIRNFVDRSKRRNLMQFMNVLLRWFIKTSIIVWISTMGYRLVAGYYTIQ